MLSWGDQRRTQAAGEADRKPSLCRHPGGSLPEKLHSPKDLKALYRLCDCDDVTHQPPDGFGAGPAVLSTIMQDNNDTVLILHDASTELDYTSHKSLTGQLGQIGNGHGRGLLCHNSLAVKADSREVVGLANQILHRRVQVPKNETVAAAAGRVSRAESRLWLLGVAHFVGRLASGGCG